MTETKEQHGQATLDSLLNDAKEETVPERSVSGWIKISPPGSEKPKPAVARVRVPASEAAEQIQAGREAEKERDKLWRIPREALEKMREAAKR